MFDIPTMSDSIVNEVAEKIDTLTISKPIVQYLLNAEQQAVLEEVLQGRMYLLQAWQGQGRRFLFVK